MISELEKYLEKILGFISELEKLWKSFLISKLILK